MIWQGHLTESANYSLVTALIGFICKYLLQPIEDAAFQVSAREKQHDALLMGLSLIIGVQACLFAYLNGYTFLYYAYGA